jgi:hypothetical protein
VCVRKSNIVKVSSLIVGDAQRLGLSAAGVFVAVSDPNVIFIKERNFDEIEKPINKRSHPQLKIGRGIC